MKISKKYIWLSIILIMLGFSSFFTFLPVRADSSLINSQTGIQDISTVYGGDHPADIRATIAKIIDISLGFIGVIFLGLSIFAGFEYMTASGNEEKTKEAVGLLRNAIIGLIIILMAWGITRYSIYILSRTANNAVDYTSYPY